MIIKLKKGAELWIGSANFIIFSRTPPGTCNVIVNLQVKPTTLLKLYSKMFFTEIFSEFLKKLLYFQISSPITDAYLEPNQKSMMELFDENSSAKKFHRRYLTGF